MAKLDLSGSVHFEYWHTHHNALGSTVRNWVEVSSNSTS